MNLNIHFFCGYGYILKLVKAPLTFGLNYLFYYDIKIYFNRSCNFLCVASQIPSGQKRKNSSSVDTLVPVKWSREPVRENIKKIRTVTEIEKIE